VIVAARTDDADGALFPALDDGSGYRGFGVAGGSRGSAEMSDRQRLTIVIASPLEPDLVERIRRFAPGHFSVLHDPELLPKPRYVADHTGGQFERTEQQKRIWAAMLAQADILFDFDLQSPADLPRRAPRLRWVQATSAGIGEFIARHGLARSGIAFTTAAGVHARSLAEFTMLGLLHFFRGMPHLADIKRRHHWERYTVRGLEGARALVVGLGSVGREIARHAAFAGVEVIGLRRTGDASIPEGVVRVIDRGALRRTLPECDALVLSCPLTDETRLMIDKPEIDAFRPGMVLVNIARGGVINEPEMIAALQDGRLAGAALDVFATEPLPFDSPLWDLPNVIISPHSASTVAAESGRIVDIFLDNLGRLLDGRPFRNLYQADRGY
jgi:glyoxylate/hydroxypyruvate reductase A